MFQIGALAALEDCFEGVAATQFDLYVGTASGATVAAALAGGLPVTRLYRALLDPADNFFPLERSHILRFDWQEWRRTISTGFGALFHGAQTLASRAPEPAPTALWEQLDRFYDSLPAGLFTLEVFERLLEDVFARRGVPNAFAAMPKPLRIVAHDLDSGARVLFGAEGFDHVPVARACTASLALPLFFSPVRIGDRHYVDGSVGGVAHTDVATGAGASAVVIVNPMVPVRASGAVSVPTGHGERGSVRDKGLLWVYNQAMRIGVHARLHASIAAGSPVPTLVVEPDPNDAVLFMHNPASFSARRTILEWAYRTTKAQARAWLRESPAFFEGAGWRERAVSEPAA